jgi:hypothetical protein
MQELGRLLVVVGAAVLGLGLVLLFAARIPWLGRLPGDIVLRRGPVTVYFPLVTCLVVSIVASILLALFRR